MGKWLTMDSPTGSKVVCWTIFIYDNQQIMAAIQGALDLLTSADNWEEYGAMTPEQTAAIMQEIVSAIDKAMCP